MKRHCSTAFCSLHLELFMFMASNERGHGHGRSGADTVFCCGLWFLRAIFVLVNMFMALTHKLRCYGSKSVVVCVHIIDNLYIIAQWPTEQLTMKQIFAYFVTVPHSVKWNEQNGTHRDIRIEKSVLTVLLLLVLLLFFRKWQLNEMCSSFLSRHIHMLV